MIVAGFEDREYEPNVGALGTAHRVDALPDMDPAIWKPHSANPLPGRASNGLPNGYMTRVFFRKDDGKHYVIIFETKCPADEVRALLDADVRGSDGSVRCKRVRDFVPDPEEWLRSIQ